MTRQGCVDTERIDFRPRGVPQDLRTRYEIIAVSLAEITLRLCVEIVDVGHANSQ